MTGQGGERPRIAFGNGHIASLGSPSAIIYGHGHPMTEALQKYRSPNSWVGRSRSDHTHYWVCYVSKNICFWCGEEQNG